MPFNIQYSHLAELGGLRKRQAAIAPEVNAFWTNGSFHNYADYAMGKAFHDGLTHLIKLGRGQRCAVMCAEAVWWRCHRRIIADYLIVEGEVVFHILGPKHIEPAHDGSGGSPAIWIACLSRLGHDPQSIEGGDDWAD
jgi:uncharacterized protein (DUF488 family)